MVTSWLVHCGRLLVETYGECSEAMSRKLGNAPPLLVFWRNCWLILHISDTSWAYWTLGASSQQDEETACGTGQCWNQSRWTSDVHPFYHTASLAKRLSEVKGWDKGVRIRVVFSWFISEKGFVHKVVPNRLKKKTRSYLPRCIRMGRRAGRGRGTLRRGSYQR